MIFGVSLYLIYRRRENLPILRSVERKFEER
jgi:hypothetical protein